MKIDNPFDKMLDVPSVRRKTTVAESAPYIVDMLELAWAGARAVFEKQAKPEHAFMLLPLLMKAADDERQRILAEAPARMEAAAKRSAKRPPAPK